MPNTTWVTVPSDDEPSLRAYLATPECPGPHPGVVVLHELFGVNADIRGIANDLADEGVVALAPVLYYRDGSTTEYAKDDAGRRGAFAALGRVSREAVVADVAAALAYLDGRPDVAPGSRLLGFSAGAHLAVLAAASLPVRTTVALYPGWLGTTEVAISRPEPTITLAPGISGRVVIVIGEADHVVGAEELRLVGQSLREAGVDHEIVQLPGVGHAFFWPDGAMYDRSARQTTWTRVVEELRAP